MDILNNIDFLLKGRNINDHALIVYIISLVIKIFKPSKFNYCMKLVNESTFFVFESLTFSCKLNKGNILSDSYVIIVLGTMMN